MWYVVQTRTGTEESIRIQCKKNVSAEVLERCFIPYYEEQKRIRGEWTTQTKVLFPGYVFMITENVEALYEELKTIIGLTKLIGTGEEIVPLQEEEIAFLESFGGAKQYAEDIFEEMPIKEENGIFDFMFAGNIGTIQSVETILEAANLLKDEPVRFHIIGGGTDLERLQKIGKNLENVEFYGRKPLEEMPDFYKKADAMLVTLAADPVLSLTLPGKVQSYMAVGKPLIGAIDGETEIVINEAQCGFCGKAGDAIELTENIRKFIARDTDRKLMGKNARKFYEKNFKESMYMDKLESMVEI